MVSHRRSLYRQSTGRGASYANDLDENIVHWERVWVAPLPISTSTSGTANTKVNGSTGVNKTSSGGASGSGNLEDDQTAAQATLSFKVKVWAQLESSTDFVSLKDGDDDDYINLEAATIHSQGRKVNAVGQSGNDSLSAADIRGAVGGGEDVSISSYTSNEAKPKASGTAPGAATTTEAAQPAPLAPVSEVKSEAEPVADSAVPSAPEANSIAEPVSEATTEPIAKPDVSAVAEPAGENATELAVESALETTTSSATEPTTEPTTKPVTESESEPVPENSTTSEPVSAPSDTTTEPAAATSLPTEKIKPEDTPQTEASSEPTEPSVPKEKVDDVADVEMTDEPAPAPEAESKTEEPSEPAKAEAEKKTEEPVATESTNDTSANDGDVEMKDS